MSEREQEQEQEQERHILFSLLSRAYDHLDGFRSGCECDDIDTECIDCLCRKMRIVLNAEADRRTKAEEG